MKRYNKYIGLFLLSLGVVSCDVNNELDPIIEPTGPNVALNTNGVDFSNYVSVGASFTAGFSDGALFQAAQQNSFPNILASKFAMAGGGEFSQPLMEDNIGGMFNPQLGEVPAGLEPRLYFNALADSPGPERLDATPSTIVGMPASNAIAFNNFGIPGAKSFHFVADGYGSPAGLMETPPTANPYYVRMSPGNSGNNNVLTEVAMKQPTFFTLSEIGGNDVLGYALSGGVGVNQTGNLDPSTYGSSDITDPNVFASVFNGMVTTLTAGGAKGVVGNLPYITSLAHFTTVPYNPLDPSDPMLSAQIPLLNSVFGAINQVYAGAGQPERSIVFSETEANAMVIYDEDATDLTQFIIDGLQASPTFVPFVESLGLPPQAAPLVAQLLGQQYGKARTATSADLFVLPSSGIIGTVNEGHAAALITQSGGLLPATLAGQFSAEGITLPLSDKWVLTPQEQAEVKTATDAYNATIENIVAANANVILVDLNGILQNASTIGVKFDDYTLTTALATGGLISLDGVHLTSRGYALMANKILEAMDGIDEDGDGVIDIPGFGTNFTEATNGLAKADDFPTNYSPALR
ncbi:SGNH/GDSL hydrolase family protein [Tenacibaculum sp. IB213877]|uniref:SGNH/GDSL hydrolase family protein n=1 Tax=Tenacibaculum sp. IB213877 TaxID=3097351 RepID=UPI002A59FA99|nr:SGNH/GDSL hydrolase family protein [Tenacibaculum sp. IB213877]MDY0780597.1 G-D-S-L family lipolytic protein [Tenacibaculum sp. IB213877]